MCKTKLVIVALFGVLFVIATAACGDDGGGIEDPGFGSDAEVKIAEDAVSLAMSESYSDPANSAGKWAFFPDGNADEIDVSAAPHGNGFAQIFVNKAFIDSAGTTEPANPAEGSVIVKNNLTENDATKLDSITVMIKQGSDFDPDNKNWFYAKLDTSGKVLSNPDGVRLAGKIGVKTDTACFNCHKKLAADDFVVTEVKAASVQ